MATSPTVWPRNIGVASFTRQHTSVVARTSASLEGCYFTVPFWSMSPRSQYMSSIVMLAVVIDIGLMVISCVVQYFCHHNLKTRHGNCRFPSCTEFLYGGRKTPMKRARRKALTE